MCGKDSVMIEKMDKIEAARAILVGINTPDTTVEETEKSLCELERLL